MAAVRDQEGSHGQDDSILAGDTMVDTDVQVHSTPGEGGVLVEDKPLPQAAVVGQGCLVEEGACLLDYDRMISFRLGNGWPVEVPVLRLHSKDS